MAFANNVFENFERQNLFSGNSLFKVVVEQNQMVDCVICMDHSVGLRATCVCGHAFHFGCLREVMFGRLAAGRICPTCRTPLLDRSLGVGLPDVPGDAGEGGQAVITNHQFFVPIANRGMMIGENKERVMLPCVLETIELPKVLIEFDNPTPVEFCPPQLYYGRTPKHTIQVRGTAKVCLVPGLVAELQMFWLHKERTYDNYCLSVLRCRELLRKVCGNAMFIEYNLRYAPVAALYQSRGAMEVAALVNPNFVPKGKWIKDMIMFVLFLLLTYLLVLMALRCVRGYSKEEWKRVFDLVVPLNWRVQPRPQYDDME